MKKITRAISVFVTLLATSATWGAAPDTCTRFLSKGNPEHSAQSHGNPEQELAELRHGLSKTLDPITSPFKFVTDYQQSADAWEKAKLAFPELSDVLQEHARATRENRVSEVSLESNTLQRARTILNKITIKQGGTANNPYEVMGAIEALFRLENLHTRLRPIPEKKSEEQKIKEEKKSEPQPKKQSGPKKPPNYPDAMERYKAQNKDTDKGSSESSGPPETLARIDEANIARFEMVQYASINARTGQWDPLPLQLPPERKASRTPTRTEHLYPFRKTGQILPVLIAEGYIPSTFKNDSGEVWMNEYGNYFYLSNGEDFQVPMYKESDYVRKLTPSEQNAFTTHTGIELHELPDDLKVVVDYVKATLHAGKITGRDKNHEIAKLLGTYIAQKFLYKVDGEKGVPILESMQRRAIQCDGAATLLITLLRNEFNIPCVAVGGFIGSRKQGTRDSSHVHSDSEGHAWVKVFNEDGSKTVVDPTPLTPDRKKDQKGSSENPYQDNTDPEQPKPEKNEQGDPGEQNEGSETSKSSDASSESASQSLKKIIEELQKKKTNERSQKATGSGSQVGNESENAEIQAALQKEAAKKSEEAAQKAIENLPGIFSEQTKSLSEHLKEMESKNPLTSALLRRMLAHCVDSTLTTAQKRARIQKVAGSLSEDKYGLFPAFKPLLKILSELKHEFRDDRPAFHEWIDSILGKAAKTPLNETALQLAHLQLQIEWTLKILEPVHDDEEIRRLRNLLLSVWHLRQALSQVRSPHSEAIRLAEELDENLPGNISKKAIRKQIGFTGALGDNLSTLQYADAIQKGRLNDYRLQAILGPHTQWAVDPINRPAKGSIVTWMREQPRPNLRASWLPAQDVRDLKRGRFMQMQPGISVETALKRGQVATLIPRRRVGIPDGVESIDPEKVTLIAVDTSGSMSGLPSQFLKEYVRALVDKALSDVSADGRTRHRVHILLFNSVVHATFEVTSVDEAVRFMEAGSKLLANAGGGTEFDPPLLKMADMIETARKTGDRGLARATAIICTDGQARVSIDKVQTAFLKAKGEAKLLLGFVSIGTSNPDLERLAEMNALGADRSMHLAWTHDDMQTLTEKSQAPAKAMSDFWSSLHWNQLPPEVYRASHELMAAQREYMKALARKHVGNEQLTRIEHEVVGMNGRKRVKLNLETLAPRLRSFRLVLNHVGHAFTPRERRDWLESVFSNWDQVMDRRGFPELDQEEAAHLIWILQWPDIGKAGNQ